MWACFIKLFFSHDGRPVLLSALTCELESAAAQIAPLSTAKIRRARKVTDKVKDQEKDKEKEKKEKEKEKKKKEKEKEKGKDQEQEQEKDSTVDTTETPIATNNLLKGPEDSNSCRALALVDLSIVKVDEDEPLVATYDHDLWLLLAFTDVRHSDVTNVSYLSFMRVCRDHIMS